MAVELLEGVCGFRWTELETTNPRVTKWLKVCVGFKAVSSMYIYIADTLIFVFETIE